jgi:DNA-binding transcriptional LysR family regulator
LTQLNYFKEVVRLKSFTKASNELFISQSTLSKAIRALEEEYKVILINRGVKNFEITKEGQILYEYAEKIIGYYNQQVEELSERLYLSNNTFRLGVPPTAGAIYCNSIIHKFQKIYPEVRLDILQVNSKEIIEKVAEGKLDAGFIIDPYDDSRLEKKKVFTTEAVLVVPKKHRLAKKRSVSFPELRYERLLMVSPEYMYYDLVKSKCLEAGFTPQFAFESYQWEFIFEMVANEQGVTIFPKPLVDKFNNARVSCIHLENPTFEWSLSVIRQKDRVVTGPMKRFWNIFE